MRSFSGNSLSHYHSWGRQTKAGPVRVLRLDWLTQTPELASVPEPMLAFGRGRSYGDACLNDGGVLLDASALDRFIAFDEQAGLIRCEAGATLAEILKIIVPRGWFVPVTPGTKHVSVGGAIANDVHGKNHHRMGTFGCHVTQLELLRSDGHRVVCSSEQNRELFQATIGGLGLTGLILWAEFRLKRIRSPWIRMDRIPFRTLEEFSQLTDESDGRFEYTVAWIDALAPRGQMGRGVFYRGNHDDTVDSRMPRDPRGIRMRMDAPGGVINRFTMRLFNGLYFRAPARNQQLVSHDEFFYPLDAVAEWNRIYGAAGFFQYQCVLPPQAGPAGGREMLERIHASGQTCALAVLKVFGSLASPGMLSFPRPGLTLALDFPNRGERTEKLFRELDAVVARCGGAIYPAKDARMPPELFQAAFPRWKEFARYKDPHFSSNFWRRVTRNSNGATR